MTNLTDEVRLVASLLEDWDMKPPPNEFTGHDYSEVAHSIIAALRQPDAVPGDLVERVAKVKKWLDGGCSSWGTPAQDIRKIAAAIQSLTAGRDAALAMVADLASELESELDAKGIYDTPRKMVRNRQTVVKARALLEGSKP